MVEALSSQGKTVILLGDPPVFPSGGGDCVIRHRFLKRDDSSNCRVAASYVEALLTPSNMILESLTRKYSNVYFFRASHQFCRGGWCYPALDGQVLMRDEHHLNELGSRKLAATMGAVFSAGLSSIRRAGGAD